jgi:hypothetical protein
MKTALSGRWFAGVVLAGAALAVSGCQSGMTYGTGKSPAMQTIEDVTGLATFSGPEKEAIDYKPRPEIVQPPAGSTLPPPSSGTMALAATNWPVDPDASRQAIREDAAARQAAGLPPAVVAVPRQQQQTVTVRSDKPLTKEETEALRAQFAAARGTALAVDENGNPVRRFLDDPPNEYRLPDPEHPVEVTTKQRRGWRWWWQRDEDTSTPPAGNEVATVAR